MSSKTQLKASLKNLPKIASELLSMAEEISVIAFRGDLGAGKTTLIKNICNLLHVKDEVNSPTYSLVNEYATDSQKTIFHFDFYRIENEEEAYDIGIEDYLYSNAWCFIEWPERIENLLPEEVTKVTIDKINEKLRSIHLKN